MFGSKARQGFTAGWTWLEAWCIFLQSLIWRRFVYWQDSQIAAGFHVSKQQNLAHMDFIVWKHENRELRH